MEKTINGRTKSEAMELAFKLGFESEKNRHGCSQSSFHAVSTLLGFQNPQVFKSLLALQGGGADSGLNSCGAFCGPLVAFSLLFGRDYEQWKERKMDHRASELGSKLLARFRDHYGSAICHDVQTHCMGFGTAFVKNGVVDREAIARFEREGGHEIVAPTVVGRASAWAVEILWEELPGDMEVASRARPGMAEREAGDMEVASRARPGMAGRQGGRGARASTEGQARAPRDAGDTEVATRASAAGTPRGPDPDEIDLTGIPSMAEAERRLEEKIRNL